MRQIELTLERWRWLPPFETPPIIVNIPQFRLFAFRSTADLKADILQMDVIVGRTYAGMQTPVFAADMRYVIFRPYWDVPRSIARRELLPAIRRNPLYLGKQHMEIVGGSDDWPQPLAATPENLAAIDAGRLRLRQQPGRTIRWGRSSSCCRTFTMSTCTQRRLNYSFASRAAPSVTAASGSAIRLHWPCTCCGRSRVTGRRSACRERWTARVRSASTSPGPSV